MENPLINPKNLINFPLNPPTIPLANGISSVNHEDDIEMITLESKSYTSLKDVLPASPPSTSSPTSSSWREIPIKDPLLQHAAWAYLQPMAEARNEDDRWWRRLEKMCCGLFSCFHDVVLGWFADQETDYDCKVH
ncbi:hypothetical protein CDL12_08134 [Handroanthus impetiginosus]|uniref:Uncharacterized protein n=1 Tax=Handroanthus impetiginosus TaxID=429701 RepID=A0A2G9HPH5_9LAMI|nr:hypothetical protein CDL12_08134 [Handroanthus impetiginosus]